MSDVNFGFSTIVLDVRLHEIFEPLIKYAILQAWDGLKRYF